MIATSAARKSANSSKNARFFARISATDKRLIEEAASLSGQSAATFVVSTARRAAADLLSERRVIRLNAEESRRLVGALLAPPKPPTKKFLKGLEIYRESVVSDVNSNSGAVLAKHRAARKAVR